MAERLPNHNLLIADPGVDDAFGVLVEMVAAGPTNVLLVGVQGNAQTDIASANLRGLASFSAANRKDGLPGPEVYFGADRALNAFEPYVPNTEEGNLFFIHGENVCEGQFNDFTPAETPSAVLYDSLVGEERGIDVISLGAVTEAAVVVSRTDLPPVNSITIMGGAIFAQGNVAPRVEANLAHDPEAFRTVLQTAQDRGIPTTLVPLDVTQHPDLELSPDRFYDIADRLRSLGSEQIAELLTRLVGPGSTYAQFYQEKQGVFDHKYPYQERQFQGPAIHDLTAVMVKHHPELFHIVAMPIVMSDDGILGVPTSWMTDQVGIPCDVVMDIVDPEQYWNLTVDYLSQYR